MQAVARLFLAASLSVFCLGFAVSAGATVYDFTGITSPSSGHTAEDGEIDVDDSVIENATFPARRGTAITGWANWGEASTAEYAALVGSDDSRYQGAGPGWYDNAAMLFTFYVNEDPGSIGQIDVSVEIGRQVSSPPGWVYLWNYNTSSYVALGTHSGTADAVVSASIDTNAGDYVESGTGQLTIFVVNQDTNAWIRVDDISVTTHLAGTPCTENWECDDANPCTDDVCGVSGFCEYGFNTDPCDDGVACTANDVCSDGVCAGTDSCPSGEQCNPSSGLCESCVVDDDCDDANPCTDDVCNAGLCENTPNPDLCVIAYPATDDFEEGFGSWSNVGGDDIDWTRDSGGTTSSGTGPSVDHTTGTSSGFYLYTESSGYHAGYPNRTALLEGPCLELGEMDDATWTFWYHMWGSSMGTLEAQVAPDCGPAWTTEFSVSGNQGDQWHAGEVDLSAFAGGQVGLRFSGVTGSSYTSDMALDDISVNGTPSRPSSYDDFVVWDPDGGVPLEDAIANATHLFVPEGPHAVQNPVVIDRDGPLFLHGEGIYRTRLVAQDPDQPLFIVNAAARIGVDGVWIEASVTNRTFVAFDFRQSSPLPVEIQNTFIARGSLYLGGPGTYVLQAVLMSGDDLTEDNIVVDHEGAELYVVGGKLVGASSANLHQLRGHVEVYGPLLNRQGEADVKLERPSPLGAHIVASTRTEGTEDLTTESRLVYVPETDEAVDVVVKANNFAALDTSSGTVVDYNGAGTVWILSNTTKNKGYHLAEGDAPSATIVAIANMQEVLEPGTACPPDVSDILPINAGTKIHAYNMYNHQTLCGTDTAPLRHFVYPDVTFADYANIPAVPQNANGGSIPLLDMPVMNAALGKLVDVTKLDPPAIPDDGLSDRAAIQAALDIPGRVGIYLPAGEYLVEEPLYWNHSLHPEPDPGWPHGFGGRIVGAGSSRTMIRNTAGGSAFATQGMVFVVVQGITFSTTGDDVAAFDLDTSQDVGATRSNSFHDVVFEGGLYGLGIALSSSWQGDGTFCGKCVFRNARIGIAKGGWNSVGNIVHGGRFENNEINVRGGLEPGSGGGSIWIFSAVSRGVRTREFEPVGSYHYINELDSDAPQLSIYGSSAAFLSVFIENSALDAGTAVADPYMELGRAGAYTYLRSNVGPGVQRLTGSRWAQVLLSLHSDFPGFGDVELVGPYDAKDQLP